MRMKRKRKRLRQLLTIERNQGTQAPDGQPLEDWQPFRKCWGGVIDRTGRESARGDGREAIIDAIVEIRYPREGQFPVAEDRILFSEGGIQRTLNIVAVRRVDEGERFLELQVREGP